MTIGIRAKRASKSLLNIFFLSPIQSLRIRTALFP
jgi:hypothetical protein